MFLPFEDFFRSLFRFLPLSSPCFFSLFGKLYGACVFICCQNAVRYGRVSECVFLHESSDYVFVYGCCTTNRIRQRWNTFATHLHISSGGRGNLWYQFSVRIGMMILCCLFALACVFFSLLSSSILLLRLAVIYCMFHWIVQLQKQKHSHSIHMSNGTEPMQ